VQRVVVFLADDDGFTTESGARIEESFDWMRFSVKTTSSAVKGDPSCHLTFGRRWKRQTVGDVCSQDTASPGSSPSVRLRRTRGS
jgi:hypothetical protein